MNKLVAVAVVTASCVLSSVTAHGQTTSPKENNDHVISDRDINLWRKNLRSQRKQLIAANLQLSDAEAAKFWPIYDQYVTALMGINDKKFAVTQDYADKWGN